MGPDGAGREVRVRRVRALVALAGALLAAAAAAAAPPERIVCMAPGLCETVAALGAGARLVGVSDYARWPSAVAALPRVGGLVDPNLERILALAPDLVLLPSPMPRLERAAAAAGIPAVQVPMEDLASIRAGILRVAELLAVPDEGRAVVGRLDAELAALAPPAGGRRPRVMLVVDRPATAELRAATVAGPGTFLDELLRAVGGRNVFADVGRRYLTPSLEEVLRRHPDLIIELAGGADDDAQAHAAAQWATLFPAGEAPPVRVITDPAVTIPGPRVVLAAQRLAAALATAEAAP